MFNRIYFHSSAHLAHTVCIAFGLIRTKYNLDDTFYYLVIIQLRVYLLDSIKYADVNFRTRAIFVDETPWQIVCVRKKQTMRNHRYDNLTANVPATSWIYLDFSPSGFCSKFGKVIHKTATTPTSNSNKPIGCPAKLTRTWIGPNEYYRFKIEHMICVWTFFGFTIDFSAQTILEQRWKATVIELHTNQLPALLDQLMWSVPVRYELSVEHSSGYQVAAQVAIAPAIQQTLERLPGAPRKPL